MTDTEYERFLTALARKHVSSPIGPPDEVARLENKLREMIRLSREVQDARRPAMDKDAQTKEAARSLFYALQDRREEPVLTAQSAMERAGILAALEDAPDAVFGNLRASAIPQEDLQLLYRAGIEDPELEIAIAVEYAKARGLRAAPQGISERLYEIEKMQRDVAEQLAKGAPPPKKRKILNGIGKILGGAIAGTGNVLLLCGTILAPNPATGAGAIASGAVAVASIFQGAGDLRGE